MNDRFNVAKACLSLMAFLVMTQFAVAQCDADGGPDIDVCFNNGNVVLPTGPNGSWAGPNVLGNQFSPVAIGSWILYYTVDDGTCSDTDEVIVNVLSLPEVNAGADIVACEGQQIQLNASASSTNGSIIYQNWNPGDNLDNANSFSPILTPSAGTNILQLTIIDAAGCSSFDAITVSVNDSPTVTCQEDVTICNNATPLQLTASPSGGTWSGLGVNASGEFVNPSGPGNYELTYIYEDANGCSGTDTVTVTVSTSIAVEAGSNVSVCSSEEAFLLTGFSPAGGIWSGPGIVDGSTGLFDPSQAGDGTFFLTYTYGASDCAISDVIQAEVLASPEIVSGSLGPLCENEPYQEIQGFSPSGGIWTGPGIVHPWGDFSPAGLSGDIAVTYTVTGTNGCTSSEVLEITVNDVPVADFTLPAELCSNVEVSIENTSVGADTFNWTFEPAGDINGFEPNFFFGIDGVQSLQLTATSVDGCSDVKTRSTMVTHPPVAEFSMDTEQGCAPLEVNFTNLSDGENTTFSWDFVNNTSGNEDPLPVVFPQQEENATYDIVLTATNQCGSSEFTDQVLVFPQPHADFELSVIEGCSPVYVEFDNQSSASSVAFEWNMGNGDLVLTEDADPIIYTTDSSIQTFSISLAATNGCGTHMTSKELIVHPKTVFGGMDVNTVAACAPFDLEVTGTATGALNYVYQLGSDIISVDQDATAALTIPGIYELYQYVDDGCSFDTLMTEIEVYALPIVSFSVDANNYCEGTVINFTNTSATGVIPSWSFGDSATSSEQHPEHSFATSGDYTVELSAAHEDNGCIVVYEEVVTIDPSPTVSFSTDELNYCSPAEIQIDNSSSIGTMTWTLNGADVSNETNPVFDLSNDGNDQEEVNITLLVTSEDQCIASSDLQVFLNPSPTAAFEIDEENFCGNVEDLGVSAASGGQGEVFLWTLNSANYADQEDILINIEDEGTYLLELTIENDFGCIDQAFDSFDVFAIPEPDFALDVIEGCAPLSVSVANLSTGNNTYDWELNGISSSTAENPIFTLDNAGNYDILLSVLSNDGCEAQMLMEDALTVHGNPQADFNYSPNFISSLDPQVSFVDQSTDAVTWEWNFGDGNFSSEANPYYEYTGAGTFDVLLLVTSAHGCQDSLMQELLVRDDFNFFSPTAFTPDGDGINEVFKPIFPIEKVREYQFTVYDKWGEPIFQTNDPEKGWIGNAFKGEYYVPSDSYNWEITISLAQSADIKKFQGIVTLLR